MSYFKKIKQDVELDVNNTSLTNVNAGVTYTPETGTSTLGISGIQVSL
jgi:hypothetical protein